LLLLPFLSYLYYTFWPCIVYW